MIICAAGHHIREGRWLADPKVLDDYIALLFHTGYPPHNYSCWLADSVWQRYCVSGDCRGPAPRSHRELQGMGGGKVSP